MNWKDKTKEEIQKILATHQGDKITQLQNVDTDIYCKDRYLLTNGDKPTILTFEYYWNEKTKSSYIEMHTTIAHFKITDNEESSK